MSITINPADWTKCRRHDGRFINLKSPAQARASVGTVIVGVHPQLVPSKPGYFRITSADGRPACDFYRTDEGAVVVSDRIFFQE